MQRLTLNGTWEFRKIGEDTWLTGTVPGSVYADLLQLNKMPDPFYRDNEEKVRALAAFDYEYQRMFHAGEELLANDVVRLVFEGIDTVAEIYLNDQLLRRADNMHRTYVIDVKDILNQGENTLRVVLLSPLQYIEKKQKEIPIWGVEDAVEGFPHLRKAHSMFGWDWGPQLPDAGIWKSVSLQGFTGARLDDIYITQIHEKDSVRLNVAVEKECLSDSHAAAVARVFDPDGELIHEVREVSSGENMLLSLTVENPQKWYPVQYGGQPLYKVEIELLSNGKVADVKSYTIGLRTIEVVQEDDEWGQSFYFRVNGIPIFAKGANYIPEDNILARTNRERTERLIQDCVAANYNMIRVWGGGNYPNDYFFELCDQYGLLVWQDFMFACAVYDLSEEFAATVREEVRDNVRRIRHHACLSIWCGNNELETAWVDWGFPKTKKHREDYLKLFESLISEEVAAFDPQTFYWPSSPSSGGSFHQPNDENVGDVHYWDVWHGLKPFTEYRKFYFRFVSEFGFQSFPAMKTIDTFTEPEDRNIFSYVMEKHQKNGAANGKILYYLSENFKYPKDLDSLVYTSQILQAEAIKYGVEHWRRNFGRSMGAVYWQLNDCWPVASWASIDYYGRWKALHYFAKRFFNMVLVSVKEGEADAEIVVTNDFTEAFSGKVTWALRTNRSEIVEQGEEAVRIDGLTASQAVYLDFTDKLQGVDRRRCYLEYKLYDAEGAVVSKGTVLFAPAKHFEFLDPALRLEVSEQAERFDITVSAAAFAKYVEVDHPELDFVLSDNYFDISAGEPVTVGLQKDKTGSDVTLAALQNGLKVRSIFNTY